MPQLAILPSCSLCQQRKVKCDRKYPCSNCVKSQTACVQSVPAVRRRRQNPTLDLQDRLDRVERLLKQYTGGFSSDHDGLSQYSDGTNTQADSPSIAKAARQDSLKGEQPSVAQDLQMLSFGTVQVNDGVRFLDSSIRAGLFNELDEMRHIILENYDRHPRAIGVQQDDEVLNTGFLFNNPTAGTIPSQEGYPTCLFRLWQGFLDRVNPLTKIVHIPTLQPFLVEAAEDISNVTADYQALIWSICTLTAASLPENELRNMINSTEHRPSFQFLHSTRMALGRCNILEACNMVVLQAMSLYLLSLQIHGCHQDAWVLYGLTRRMARKLGYHRDGYILQLSPFETEMRRRIWWHIITSEAQLSLDVGFDRASLPYGCDTLPPSNFNDADLYTTCREPFKPRQGPTEMAYVLLRNQCYRLFFNWTSVSTHPGPMSVLEIVVSGKDLQDNNDPNWNNPVLLKEARSRIQYIQKTLVDLEERVVNCSAGPVHQAALTLRPMFGDDLMDLMVPLQEQREWGSEIFSSNDLLFKIGLYWLKFRADRYDTMTSAGFGWLIKLQFQRNLLGTVMDLLYKRPLGSLADSAWNVLDKVYSHIQELLNMSLSSSVHLATIALRSWGSRERALAMANSVVYPPSFIIQLRQTLTSTGLLSSDPIPKIITTQPPVMEFATLLASHSNEPTKRDDQAVDINNDVYLIDTANDFTCGGDMHLPR